MVLYAAPLSWRSADRMQGAGDSGKNQRTEELESLKDCREQGLPHPHVPADLCEVPVISPVGEAGP